MKAVDDLMPGVDIFGCFFHLKKVFQKKVDKKGMREKYETDQKFNNFVNECGALAHLPEDDLEDGLKHIEAKYTFEEEKMENFKTYMCKYI